MVGWSRRVWCIPLGLCLGSAFAVSAFLIDHVELARRGIPLAVNWGLCLWAVLGPLATVVLACWPTSTKVAVPLAALFSGVAFAGLPSLTDMTLPWDPVAQALLILGLPMLSFVVALVVRLDLLGASQLYEGHRLRFISAIVLPGAFFGWLGWSMGSNYRLDTESQEALSAVDRMVERALSMPDSNLPTPLTGIPGLIEHAGSGYTMEAGPYSFVEDARGACWGKAVNVFFDGGFSIGCAYCSTSIRSCQAASLEYVWWMLPPQP